MICLPPAKRTAAVRAIDHWALLVLTILVLWPGTAVQHQAAGLSRGVAPLAGSVALAPPSGAHVTKPNISHRTYGYYPNGQMSWFNKDAAGGSTSVLENNTGDVYFYQAGGQLDIAQSEAQNSTTAANAQSDSQNSTASNAQWIGSYLYDAAGNRTYDWENGSIGHFPAVSAWGGGIQSDLDGVTIALGGISTYRDIAFINDGPISADVGFEPIDLFAGFLANGARAVLGSFAKTVAKGGELCRRGGSGGSLVYKVELATRSRSTCRLQSRISGTESQHLRSLRASKGYVLISWTLTQKLYLS